MGIPSPYAIGTLPKIIIKTLSFLSLLKTYFLTILNFLGLPHFVKPEIYWPEPEPDFKSTTSTLLQEMLPVMKFKDISYGLQVGSELNMPETCTICLHEFRNHEEIRRLANCKHVLHRGCVDRWMDHGQRTCPLCRTSVIPDDLVDVFNERLEAYASPSFPEFGSEFCAINSFI